MRRSIILSTIISLAILAGSALTASAQVAQLRGHVVLKQADGTTTKPAGAVVDVYRTDLPGTYSTKTDKNGGFVYAGLQLVGTYTITASMPNARPGYLANIKVGLDKDFEIVLSPGDGRRITRDEAVKLAASGKSGAAPGQQSAEDKAKEEAVLKEIEEVKKSNEKVENTNKIVSDAFKAGNTALMAGNAADKANNRDEAMKQYGDAVQQYDTGLAADPNQPALLTNKAAALKARGVDKFNMAIGAKDDAAKTAGLESARADFKSAAETANKAYDLLKKETPSVDPAEQKNQASNKYAALVVRAEAMRLFVTKVDPTQVDASIAAFQEYMAAETDPVKKSRAQLDLAKMLLDIGAGDKAYAEFQKILAVTPDDPDANRGAGLALFSTGDKTKYKEAANYLQRFVEKAPDTHPDKQSAKDALDYLKTSENIVPEKTKAPARGKRP